MQEITIPSLFDLSKAGLAENLFAGHTYPWKVLPYIHDYILELGKTLDPAQFVERAPQVWIPASTPSPAGAWSRGAGRPPLWTGRSALYRSS